MELFRASDLVKTVAHLSIVHGVGRTSNPQALMGDSNRANLLEALVRAKRQCKGLLLRVSESNCSDLIKLLRKESYSNRSVADMCGGLAETIRREMKATTFFRLGPNDLKYLDSVKLFGHVTRMFPRALDDVEEAGKCLAFGRSTACVFHLMRALEAAVKAVWKTLNLPPPKLPENWGALIGLMDKELSFPKDKRNPLWVKEEAFFAEAVADLRAVKKAWRDTTMHVERTYSYEQAVEIFAATAALMKHLASRLDENGVMH